MELIYNQWRVETVRTDSDSDSDSDSDTVEDSELFNNFHDAWAYTRAGTTDADDDVEWRFRTLSAAHEFFNDSDNHDGFFVAAWVEGVREVRLSMLP